MRKAALNLPALRKPRRYRRLFWGLGAAASVLVALWLFAPEFQGHNGMFLQGQKSTDNIESYYQHRDLVLQARAESPDAVVIAEEEITLQLSNGSDYDDSQEESTTAESMVEDEVMPDQPVESPVYDIKEPPESIGFVRVNRNETLWKMIERVYGDCNLDLLNSVAGRNPVIDNVNIIHRDQRIDFPAHKMRKVLDDERYWLVLNTFPDLNEAYQTVFGNLELPLRVIVAWDSKNDFKYYVALKTSFRDMSAAERAVDNLHPDLRSRVHIHFFDEGVMITGL